MSGQFDVTALLFLVVAVVVFLKLRSVLGRRTEDDEARIERYRSQRAAQQQQQQQQKPQSDGKVVTLPRRNIDEAPPRPEPQRTESDVDREARIAKFAGANKPLADGLTAISKADQSFDPSEFMNGARAAYEMIVMAFAEGNRALLRDLLSPDVFSGFDEAIRSREAAKQTVEQSFVGISSADMIEAELAGRNAQVTVKFVSELISAVRSMAGEVVSGDPKKIKEVTDIWTFARDTGSRDPNWRLVATQAAN
jgi:predicted lipid-binding transport protein (Tim44 family)